MLNSLIWHSVSKSQSLD